MTGGGERPSREPGTRLIPALAVAGLLGTALTASPAQSRAADPKVEKLTSEWRDLNAACRGGSGDNPVTQVACDRREEIGERLKQLGWCYGLKDDAGYQRFWRRCDGAVR